MLHLELDTSGFPHLHVFPCPNNPPPASVTCPMLLTHPNIHTHMLSLSTFTCPHITVPAAPMLVLDTSVPTIHPSSIVLMHVTHSHDLTCAMLWDACHVCTCVHPNWVLPTVCQILQDEIHCAVMLCSMSYCCLPRSNCRFHFNSMHSDMLAYLLSPVSQKHHSISARHSPCLCSI